MVASRGIILKHRSFGSSLEAAAAASTLDPIVAVRVDCNCIAIGNFNKMKGAPSLLSTGNVLRAVVALAPAALVASSNCVATSDAVHDA